MENSLGHRDKKSPLLKGNKERPRGPKLKICGQKNNIGEVMDLEPDYLGFIFWGGSSRDFSGKIPKMPSSIKKVGVFVDAAIGEVSEKVSKYNLNVVQLHGSETPGYCARLKGRGHTLDLEPHEMEPLGDEVKIIKVFAIKDSFDFSILTAYDDVCDYFLFDTKGQLPGGNGYAFEWKVLKDYPSTKPYFLSGGIGLENIDTVLSFLNRKESEYCYAIDLNSKFEVEPGLKDVVKLRRFIKKFTSGTSL